MTLKREQLPVSLSNYEMQSDDTLPLQASDTITYTYMTLQLWDPQIVSSAALAALKLFLCSLKRDSNVGGMTGREHTQPQHFPKESSHPPFSLHSVQGLGAPAMHRSQL